MITKTQHYLFSLLPKKVQEKICVTDSGCWLWRGEINRNGYGRVYHDGTRSMAHRYIWTFLGRPLGKELLDHVYCRRDCCNPTHLSAVSHRHNTHRGRAVLFKNKTSKQVHNELNKLSNKIRKIADEPAREIEYKNNGFFITVGWK